MSREISVLLDGRPAGTLVRQTNGRLHFAYDSAYRQQVDATPLSYAMPTAVADHGHAVVLPWLSGLLPDDPAVLRRWAQEFGAPSTDPFDLLATPIGEDCAGAVQFVAPSRVDSLFADPGSVEWLTDADVEARIRRLRTDPTAWLGDASSARKPGFVGQFSLAGRQRKTALLLQNGRWGVPSGRIPTTHIMKPPIQDFFDQEVNEHLCLDAARRAGLVAAESRVTSFGAESVVVVTRYDRRRVGDRLVRVHQEDVCQALGVMPDDKYQSQRGPGPTEIARLLRSVMSVEPAEDSVRRFADALAWNWIIGGTDAHAKNYSLLLSGRIVRLAPLYDITSSLPYENERHLRMAMKIGDGYDLVDHRSPWAKAAERLRLDADALTARVADLCRRAPDAFADAAAESAILALDRRVPARLTDLVARRAGRCAKVLAKTQ